jgi:hypothetical protein
VLEVYIDGAQPLLWSATGNQHAVQRARPVLEELVHTTTFLDPAEWQTRVPEPWVQLCLSGPWRPEDIGLYANTHAGFTMLYLTVQDLPAPLDLRRNEEAMVASINSGFSRVRESSSAHADFGKLPSLSFSAEGTSAEGDGVSVRAMWLATPRQLYSILVQATERRVATTLFAEVRTGLRIPGTSGQGR